MSSVCCTCCYIKCCMHMWCISVVPCSNLTKGEGWSSLIAGALLKYVISIYVNHLHIVLLKISSFTGAWLKKNEMFNKIFNYWYLWLNLAALTLPSWSYMYIELSYFELSHVTLALHNYLHVIMIFFHYFQRDASYRSLCPTWEYVPLPILFILFFIYPSYIHLQRQ